MPTDEDAVFRFNGSMSSNKTYTFTVRQTYSSGKVVDWSGSESSDTPAPTIEAVSDLGGSSSSTLTIVALDRRRDRRRARDRRPRDERPAADVRRAAVLSAVAAAALALPAAAWAHAALLRTVPEASRTINVAAARGAAHLQRADRAALRDRLGHRRGRAAGDERPAGQRARLAADARHAARARARGLVPRLLARDLGRRPPGARRVHLRGRAEPRAAAAVSRSLAERDRDDDAAARLALARLPLGALRARPVRAAGADRPARGAGRCAAPRCGR